MKTATFFLSVCVRKGKEGSDSSAAICRRVNYPSSFRCGLLFGIHGRVTFYSFVQITWNATYSSRRN